MAAGRSNRGIASDLFLSVRHASTIDRSPGGVGEPPRAEAVAAAVTADLVERPDHEGEGVGRGWEADDGRLGA